jgi:hypothetical protein
VDQSTALRSQPQARQKHRQEKFPLTKRSDGRYCKKIRGQIFYFTGSRDDALAEWNRVKDDLLAGRVPEDVRPADSVVTVKYLVSAFLTAKKAKLAAGELSSRSWLSYEATGRRIVAELGATRNAATISVAAWSSLRAKLAESLGYVTRANEIQ